MLVWTRETVRVSAWLATVIVGVTVVAIEAIAAATGGASQGLVSLEELVAWARLWVTFVGDGVVAGRR